MCTLRLYQTFLCYTRGGVILTFVLPQRFTGGSNRLLNSFVANLIYGLFGAFGARYVFVGYTQGIWSLLWRKKGLVNYLLLPAAAVFSFAAMTRRRLYQSGFLRGSGGTHPPVVVVGNIVAGGGGKTPLVIALVEALKQRGLKPGIISRGFGGDYRGILAVSPDEDWRRCGDEALLLKRATGVPVCIGKRRCDAASHPDLAGCDLIISDDGLQHYALSRKVEICAVNGDFGVGNGWFLPAGPLRENYQRLQQCDFIVINRGVVGSAGANGFQLPRCL